MLSEHWNCQRKGGQSCPHRTRARESQTERPPEDLSPQRIMDRGRTYVGIDELLTTVTSVQATRSAKTIVRGITPTAPGAIALATQGKISQALEATFQWTAVKVLTPSTVQGATLQGTISQAGGTSALLAREMIVAKMPKARATSVKSVPALRSAKAMARGTTPTPPGAAAIATQGILSQAGGMLALHYPRWEPAGNGKHQPLKKWQKR